jgi:hypothetical protein
MAAAEATLAWHAMKRERIAADLAAVTDLAAQLQAAE